MRFVYLQVRKAQYGLQRLRAYYHPVGPYLFKGLNRDSIIVRKVKEDDIFWLEMLYGNRGRTKHRERLEMQLDGKADYLIAWHLVPVGHLLVMWDGCPDDPIAGMKEREPFLDDLAVLPAARKRGVGKTLIRAAEESILERGFERAAMTVSIKNPLSMMIYVKQGWNSAGIDPFEVNRTMTDNRGRQRIWSARVEYLVKDLRQGQDAD